MTHYFANVLSGPISINHDLKPSSLNPAFQVWGPVWTQLNLDAGTSFLMTSPYPANSRRWRAASRRLQFQGEKKLSQLYLFSDEAEIETKSRQTFFSNSNGSNFFSQMESWKVDFWRQIEKKCRLIVVVTKQTKRNGCSRSRAISRKTKLSTASRFRHRHRFSLSEPVSNRFSENCHRSWDAIFESAVTGQMWARFYVPDF